MVLKIQFSRLLRLVFAVSLLTSCSQPHDFYDLEGQGYRYKDLSENWVIVNYWATWCGPCIAEIPELNKIASNDKIVVLGVNWDDPGIDEGRADASKMKIAFPVYATDPSERLGVVKPDVLPTTYVFAPGLKLQRKLVGPQTVESIHAVVDDPT